MANQVQNTDREREVSAAATRAVALLAVLAIWLWPAPGHAQDADGATKEVRTWSAKVVGEQLVWGDESDELGYPNVNFVLGYYDTFPYDVGSLTDSEFEWKGKTWEVDALAERKVGSVNSGGVITYTRNWTVFIVNQKNTITDLQEHGDAAELTLYVDSSLYSGGSLRKFPLTSDPSCGANCDYEFFPTGFVFSTSFDTSVWLTRLATNQAATRTGNMIDSADGLQVGRTLNALRSRVADGNGRTGSRFKSQWFHVDENGENRTAITEVMDDRNYKLKIPDFGKYLQAAIIFTDDDTFEETVYSEVVGPITSAPWQPENLTATPATESVSLSWTPGDDNGSPITSYQVRYRKGNGAWSDWTTITGSSASTTSHEVTGLDENSSYTLEVRAVNDAGNGWPAQVETRTFLIPRATITGVTITSDPNDDGRTGNDDTYAFGDTITLEIAFSKAIDVTQGAPQLRLDAHPTLQKRARCAAATNTTTLTCTYTVQSGDLAVNGLPIPAHRLGGTTIVNAGTALGISPQVPVQPPDPDHKIDGVIPSIVTRGTKRPEQTGTAAGSRSTRTRNRSRWAMPRSSRSSSASETRSRAAGRPPAPPSAGARSR